MDKFIEVDENTFLNVKYIVAVIRCNPHSEYHVRQISIQTRNDLYYVKCDTYDDLNETYQRIKRQIREALDE